MVRAVVRSTVFRDINGKCRIGAPKSISSERSIPLCDSVAALLKEGRTKSCSDYVFPAPKSGTFISPRTLQYHFRSLLKRLGLPNVPFHALRHTFATRWIECGMDIKSLCEILGHSSVRITLDIYVHSSAKLKREGVEQLELILGQNHGQQQKGL